MDQERIDRSERRESERRDRYLQRFIGGYSPKVKTSDDAAVMFTLKELIESRISAFRNPSWKHPLEHMRIDFVGTDVGSRARYYNPLNGVAPTEFNILSMDAYRRDLRVWVAYTGPAPHTSDYLKEIPS